MANFKDLGHKGEEEAEKFLKGKDYLILERNYRKGRSEIDIIAQKKDMLIFVEVKVRSTNLFGFPESFVSEQQEERIMEAAEEYQIEIGWSGKVRYDIISIENERGDWIIRHFKDAIQ